jgi:hypothetical protein
MYLMSVCVIQRIASNGDDDDVSHLKPHERPYICIPYM